MSPDDARHGTRAGRLAGCTCPPCVAANNAYCKRYRNRRYGTESVLDDATRARRHLIEMRAYYSTVALAKLSGGNSSWICSMIAGRHERITPARARRVLAIRPGMDVGTSWVTAWPARRRAQALVALGWTLNQQATRIGYQRQNMVSLAAGTKPYITSRIDQAMRALYDELAWSEPTASDRFEAAAITKAKKQGAREGWALPIAWGEDIDDPAAIPDPGWTERAPRSRPIADTVEDFDWLVSQGVSRERAAAQVGVALATVEDYRRRIAEKETAA